MLRRDREHVEGRMILVTQSGRSYSASLRTRCPCSVANRAARFPPSENPDQVDLVDFERFQRRDIMHDVVVISVMVGSSIGSPNPGWYGTRTRNFSAHRFADSKP